MMNDGRHQHFWKWHLRFEVLNFATAGHVLHREHLDVANGIIAVFSGIRMDRIRVQRHTLFTINSHLPPRARINPCILLIGLTGANWVNGNENGPSGPSAFALAFNINTINSFDFSALRPAFNHDFFPGYTSEYKIIIHKKITKENTRTKMRGLWLLLQTRCPIAPMEIRN